MITCRSILVATDFSEPSDTAFLYGRELARLLGAGLHVVHVVNDIIAGMLPATDGPEMANIQHELEDVARTRLQEIITDNDERASPPIAVVRTSANPATEILAYIRENPIDLVVVGSHGHGAVAQLFLGSVADKLVRSAPCPVLTVRHPERDFIKPDALQATTAQG
jgi:nucleotide-binding universal stress UspA family protein